MKRSITYRNLNITPLTIPYLSYGRNGTKGNTYYNTTYLKLDISSYTCLEIEEVSVNNYYPCTIQADSITLVSSSTKNYKYDISNYSILEISFHDTNATAAGATIIKNLICK